ncbi:hypothetical protein HPP92_000426 [Vanilla planifolia]|uniref:Uncharacterized protein n=1 Tax=Vanilla planifolia TaxID=51239 RepID=A0A835S2U0_VANPL|nr:hypothetical protein HPP92_000426 [Vanilla planifolia]
MEHVSEASIGNELCNEEPPPSYSSVASRGRRFGWKGGRGGACAHRSLPSHAVHLLNCFTTTVGPEDSTALKEDPVSAAEHLFRRSAEQIVELEPPAPPARRQAGRGRRPSPRLPLPRTSEEERWRRAFRFEFFGGFVGFLGGRASHDGYFVISAAEEDDEKGEQGEEEDDGSDDDES